MSIEPTFTAHRFAPNVRDLGPDGVEIDLAAGEFRAAVAAYTLAAAEGDTTAMLFAIERVQSVVGTRGASSVQLLDALTRVTAAMHGGGPAQIRAELAAAAEFTIHAQAAAAADTEGPA